MHTDLKGVFDRCLSALIRVRPLLHGAQNADGKHKDRFNQVERSADYDANQPERQQDEPDKRIRDERDECQRPAGAKKNEEDE